MFDYFLIGRSQRIAFPLLQALHSADLGRCAVVGTPDTAVLRWSRLCRQHTVIDFADDDAAAQHLNSLAAQNPEAVLIPYDCEGIRLVNRLKGRLTLASLPLPEPATLDMFDDKWAFHQFCLGHGLPVPLTLWVGTKSALDFNALTGALGLPFVVKPTNASGSVGVVVVHGREQFQQDIIDKPGYDFSTLIAQQFIAGADMDINLLAHQGLLRAVSVHRPGAQYIEFVGHTQLEALAQKISQLSHYSGLMNVDARLENGSGRVYLIESNPRFWATLASTVYCGLNFAEASLQAEAAGTAEPLRLNSGRYHVRHPLFRPSCWGTLLLDRGPRGRLLRARTFDLYALGELLGQVPAILKRLAGRLAQALRKAGFLGRNPDQIWPGSRKV
jgi:predicted ATP-grasp superfamily ATP-dependent carboligase